VLCSGRAYRERSLRLRSGRVGVGGPSTPPSATLRASRCGRSLDSAFGYARDERVATIGSAGDPSTPRL